MSSISCDRIPCAGLFAIALIAATLAGCAHSSVVTDTSASSLKPDKEASFAVNRHVPVVAKKYAARTQDASYGLASFYGEGSQTASGEKFNAHALTAAHRSLPFGTRLRVTNVATGRSVTVRVNDRGPFVPGRIVDVSVAAAETLGIIDRGVAKVKLNVVQ